MIITLAFTILFIIGIIWFKIDDYSVGALLCLLFGGIFSCIFWLIILICNNSSYKKNEQISYQEKYIAYTSQLSGENRENNIVLLSSEIAEYNAEIKTNREFQNNIWFGWFIPDIYNDIPLIEVNAE